ncbi:hypothetical protein [Mycobacterium sp.]|uniref:hypothetical protein n=1 Tax=Mycobacterium sp. TaxID=1785 RepID=UPI003D6B9954
MKLAPATVAGVLVATMVVGAVITGCGGDGDSSVPSSPPAPSSSAASSTDSSPVASPPEAEPTDYSGLLLNASDFGFITPDPPVLNPNGVPGVAQLYTSPDGNERIGDTIVIAADPAIAAAGLEHAKANYASKVTGTWQPADVGFNGAIISGTSPDNSRAVTGLLFTEGKVLVNLEFNSAPNDPVPPADAINFGRRQDAAIKAGLPGE